MSRTPRRRRRYHRCEGKVPKSEKIARSSEKRLRTTSEDFEPRPATRTGLLPRKTCVRSGCVREDKSPPPGRRHNATEYPRPSWSRVPGEQIQSLWRKEEEVDGSLPRNLRLPQYTAQGRHGDRTCHPIPAKGIISCCKLVPMTCRAKKEMSETPGWQKDNTGRSTTWGTLRSLQMSCICGDRLREMISLVLVLVYFGIFSRKMIKLLFYETDHHRQVRTPS